MFEVRAAQLRRILLELGPAFVKIAQAVSSRPVYQARLPSSGKVVVQSPKAWSLSRNFFGYLYLEVPCWCCQEGSQAEHRPSGCSWHRLNPHMEMHVQMIPF